MHVFSTQKAAVQSDWSIAAVDQARFSATKRKLKWHMPSMVLNVPVRKKARIWLVTVGFVPSGVLWRVGDMAGAFLLGGEGLSRRHCPSLRRCVGGTGRQPGRRYGAGVGAEGAAEAGAIAGRGGKPWTGQPATARLLNLPVYPISKKTSL